MVATLFCHDQIPWPEKRSCLIMLNSPSFSFTSMQWSAPSLSPPYHTPVPPSPPFCLSVPPSLSHTNQHDRQEPAGSLKTPKWSREASLAKGRTWFIQSSAPGPCDKLLHWRHAIRGLCFRSHILSLTTLSEICSQLYLSLQSTSKSPIAQKGLSVGFGGPSREKTQRTNSISHKRTEEPSHRRGITESGGWLGKLSGGLSVRHVARILTITPLSPHRQYCTNTILQTDNTPHR